MLIPLLVVTEVRRSTGHIMVTTRYSDQQGSKSREKVMRLYKQWHQPISKRFIKPPYSMSRATSIDSECCRLPTTSVLSKKTENLHAPTSFNVMRPSNYSTPLILLLCVCVFFPSILDIKFVGRTSRGHTGGRSHRIFNPPSFCGACLDFCREKDSAIPFPRRP